MLYQDCSVILPLTDTFKIGWTRPALFIYSTYIDSFKFKAITQIGSSASSPDANHKVFRWIGILKCFTALIPWGEWSLKSIRGALKAHAMCHKSYFIALFSFNSLARVGIRAQCDQMLETCCPKWIQGSFSNKILLFSNSPKSN